MHQVNLWLFLFAGVLLRKLQAVFFSICIMSVYLQLVEVLASPSSLFQSNSHMDFFSQSVEFDVYNFVIGIIMIRLTSCK